MKNSFIAKVVELGLETKLGITKSSYQNVKPKSHATCRAGAMVGKVITKKTGVYSKNSSLLHRLNVRLPVNLKKE